MRQITAKNWAFLKLYLGRDVRYHGNATRCYMKVYDMESERQAQVSGSRLCAVPVIKQAIQKYREEAAQQMGIDAGFVLEQSVLVYDRAMANLGVEVDIITKLKDGSQVLTTVEQREHMPAIAVKALELIGKHTAVQAFQDNVEHTHTHRLVQALQAKSKQVERKAAAQPAIEGEYTEVSNEVVGEAGAGEEKKRVHQGGGQAPGQNEPEKTTAERAGATGN